MDGHRRTRIIRPVDIAANIRATNVSRFAIEAQAPMVGQRFSVEVDDVHVGLGIGDLRLGV